MTRKTESFLLVSLLVGAGWIAWRATRSNAAPPGPPAPPVPEPVPTVPPVPGPPPAPLVVPDVAFEKEGETEFTLPSGAEFNVVWDPLSPWKYIPQDTEWVQAISTGNGFIRFHVATQPPAGGFSKVSVQALAEDNTQMAEHKITLFGPQ